MSTFEIPYEFSLHESPVTFTDYLGQCPPALLEDLYATGSKFRKPVSEVCAKINNFHRRTGGLVFLFYFFWGGGGGLSLAPRPKSLAKKISRNCRVLRKFSLIGGLQTQTPLHLPPPPPPPPSASYTIVSF